MVEDRERSSLGNELDNSERKSLKINNTDQNHDVSNSNQLMELAIGFNGQQESQDADRLRFESILNKMNRVKRHSSKRKDALDPDRIIEEAVNDNQEDQDELNELEDQKKSIKKVYNRNKSTKTNKSGKSIMDSDLIVPYSLTKEGAKND